MKINRSKGNETFRRIGGFCYTWIARIHSAAASGFLWLFGKIGRALAFVPWTCRAGAALFAAALILAFSCAFGSTMLLMCGFTEIVAEQKADDPEAESAEEDSVERVDPGDEFSEQKLKTELKTPPTRFSFIGQIRALQKADLASVNPEKKKLKKDVITKEIQQRFDEAGFNRENTYFTEPQLDELYKNDAFHTLNVFRSVGWILAAFLALAGLLCFIAQFVKVLRKAAWYPAIAAGSLFAAYWTVLIVPMFLLPDTLLELNLKDFDSSMRNIIWFSYLWLWLPVLVFSFFVWFPLTLSRARAAFGFKKRTTEFGDIWERNLKCQGDNSGLYRGVYWTVSYYFFFLLVLPMILHGCYRNDEYLIPQGDGGGVVEVVVQKIKPKPKKVKKYFFSPNSAILFEIPKMDDTISENIEEETEKVYQTTSIGPNTGKKGGKAGWPDGMAGGRIRFIRLQYRGGDWDQDMGKGSDYNMLLKMKEYAGFDIAENTEAIEIQRLARWKQGKAPPFVYITGSGNINISSTEAKQIRKYLLETGGMLFADNGGGIFDRSFRNMLRQILPELTLIDISNDDPIYQSPFAFPNGAPALFHHSGTRALGLKYNGRWIVFYHQGDINDAWKTGGSGTSPEVQERAFKMGANVIAYAFTQYLAQVRMNRVQK